MSGPFCKLCIMPPLYILLQPASTLLESSPATPQHVPHYSKSVEWYWYQYWSLFHNLQEWKLHPGHHHMMQGQPLF